MGWARARRPGKIAFWRDYLATLARLDVVDPACGSGAFLIAAYDALHFEYRAGKARRIWTLDRFDIADEILRKISTASISTRNRWRSRGFRCG